MASILPQDFSNQTLTQPKRSTPMLQLSRLDSRTFPLTTMIVLFSQRLVINWGYYLKLMHVPSIVNVEDLHMFTPKLKEWSSVLNVALLDILWMVVIRMAIKAGGGRDPVLGPIPSSLACLIPMLGYENHLH